jgi:hypothetical protein
MHAVEIRDEALALAARLGYTVRQEWFAGQGGGCCELRGKKLLFLDLDLGPVEQLEQVLDALRREPDSERHRLSMSPELRKLL